MYNSTQMKNIILILPFFCFTSILMGQRNTESYFNAGIGISNWGIPLYASFEKPVASDINLGGGVSFQTVNRNKWRHTAFGLEAIGSYYADRVLALPSDFDVYGGLGLGFFFWDTKYKDEPNGFNERYDGPASSGLSLRGFVGARYHMNSKLALNLELGGGSVISGARFGLSWGL
jgi:outer membrane immunogenic protein